MLHQVTFSPNFSGWRRAARRALAQQWPPGEIFWQESTSEQSMLEISQPAQSADESAPRTKVPNIFVEIATRVVCHADPARWDLLYRILWRIAHGENQLMQIVVDQDVRKLQEMDKAIRRDVHKMRAFVRFREVRIDGDTWYVAWFEPQHHIVELNAPFFVDRFAQMNWSIWTPDLCVHWDQKNLGFTTGVTRAEAPAEDAVEDLWIRYYSNIFNPARVKTHAMQKEMPKKYWRNLPEAGVIHSLLHDAPKRVATMIANSQTKQT